MSSFKAASTTGEERELKAQSQALLGKVVFKRSSKTLQAVAIRYSTEMTLSGFLPNADILLISF